MTTYQSISSHKDFLSYICVRYMLFLIDWIETLQRITITAICEYLFSIWKRRLLTIPHPLRNDKQYHAIFLEKKMRRRVPNSFQAALSLLKLQSISYSFYSVYFYLKTGNNFEHEQRKNKPMHHDSIQVRSSYLNEFKLFWFGSFSCWIISSSVVRSVCRRVTLTCEAPVPHYTGRNNSTTKGTKSLAGTHKVFLSCFTNEQYCC